MALPLTKMATRTAPPPAGLAPGTNEDDVTADKDPSSMDGMALITEMD